MWHIPRNHPVTIRAEHCGPTYHTKITLTQIHTIMATMAEDSLTQAEHEKFMRRAIELGAIGGLKERTGGNNLQFYPTSSQLSDLAIFSHLPPIGLIYYLIMLFCLQVVSVLLL